MGEPTGGCVPGGEIQGGSEDVGRAQTKPRDDVREIQQINEVSTNKLKKIYQGSHTEGKT